MTSLFRLLTFVISIFAVTSDNGEVNAYVLLHYMIIAVSSYSMFSYEEKTFTLHKIYHIFNLFFFGIAPVLQYYDRTRFLNEPFISLDVKITVSVTILVATVLFNTIYALTYRKYNEISVEKKLLNYNELQLYGQKFRTTINICLIGLSLFSLFMMLYVNGFNIMKLLFRGGDIVKGSDSESFAVSKTIGLITNQFIRPIPLIVFMVSYLYNKKRKFLNVLLFLIFFITCCPTGLARNATAGFYLPLLMLFVPLFEKRHFFVSTMIGGIMIVFPFLNNFRRFDSNSELTIGLDYEMFTDLHFDAYMTFCRVVNLELITYGNQLLGVIFFFVPRSIWENKAQSSGYYHAEVMGLYFKNLACTFLAEGYLNFGFLGVFLFLFVLAGFCARMDKVFWTYKKHNTFFNVIYVLIVGMLLFILRGDLMNGFAYTVGVIIAALSVYKIVVRINRINFR